MCVRHLLLETRAVRPGLSTALARRPRMGRQRQQSEHHDVTSLVEDLLLRGLSGGATDLHFEPIDRR